MSKVAWFFGSKSANCGTLNFNAACFPSSGRNFIRFLGFRSIRMFLTEKQGTDDKGKPKLIVKQVFVKTGDTRGDQVAILKGVKEGDVVVTAGQVKLHNGSPVVINNEIQPSNEAHPRMNNTELPQ